jgi:hypothetical protein
VNDRVYVTDMTGVTIIFKAAGAYTELARSALGAPVVATPAFVGACIYMRSDKALYCIGKTSSRALSRTSSTKLPTKLATQMEKRFLCLVPEPRNPNPEP